MPLEWLTAERMNDIYNYFNIGLMQLLNDNIKINGGDVQTMTLCKKYIEKPEEQREFIDAIITGLQKDPPQKSLIIHFGFVIDAVGEDLTEDQIQLIARSVGSFNNLKNFIKSEGYGKDDLQFLKRTSDIVAFYTSSFSQVLRYITYTAKTPVELIDCIQIAASTSDFDDVRELASVIIDKEEFPEFFENDKRILLEEIFRLLAVVHQRECRGLIDEEIEINEIGEEGE